MSQFNGLAGAGLLSCWQRSCYIPQHLAKHSSKLTKLKMIFLYGLAYTRIENKKLLCIPRAALLVSKPTKWRRSFLYRNISSCSGYVYCTVSNQHSIKPLPMNPIRRTTLLSNVEVVTRLTLCTNYQVFAHFALQSSPMKLYF